MVYDISFVPHFFTSLVGIKKIYPARLSMFFKFVLWQLVVFDAFILIITYIAYFYYAHYNGLEYFFIIFYFVYIIVFMLSII